MTKAENRNNNGSGNNGGIGYGGNAGDSGRIATSGGNGSSANMATPGVAQGSTWDMSHDARFAVPGVSQKGGRDEVRGAESSGPGVTRRDYRETVLKRTMIAYLAWTCFAIFFGAVYEFFGRGVWSFFMVYFFCLPFVLGFIPCFVAYMKGSTKQHPQRARWCWHAFVATASFGCMFQGIMEIFGNFSALVFVYVVAAIVLLVLAIMLDKRYQGTRPS